MKISKILALVLCVAMMITMFAGCGKATVMTVDGEPITEGVYTYYYSYMFANYGSMYDAEQIRTLAENQIMRDVAIRSLVKELGLELTAAERKAMIDSREAQIEQMSRNVYVTMLKSMSLTTEEFAQIFETGFLYSKLFDYFYGENGIDRPEIEDIRAEYLAEYIRATHILISTSEAETDEDRAAIRTKAEDVLKLAKSGKDFVELVKEYGEDPGVAEDPATGYYFTKGEMVEAFETAAFALEENAISDLVETPYGYHIIKRLPMDEAYVDEMVNSEEFYESYCAVMLGEILQARIDTLTPTYEDALQTLDFSEAIAMWLGQ